MKLEFIKPSKQGHAKAQYFFGATRCELGLIIGAINIATRILPSGNDGTSGQFGKLSTELSELKKAFVYASKKKIDKKADRS
jgi:hypothetical protein